MKLRKSIAIQIGALSLVSAAQGQNVGSLPLTNLQATTGGWVLGWRQPATNTAFTVQYQDTLQDGLWRSPVTGVEFPLSSNQWSDPVTGNASRFYRVVPATPTQRGKLLAVANGSSFSTFFLSFIFSAAGVSLTPEYAVEVYKINYQTVTPLGEPILASGAVAFPVGAGGLLPLVSYQHGTQPQTNYAPSGMDLHNSEISVGLAFASQGYAVALPDYLGLGDSPGLHPYHHARSEATACVDMLRAVRTFCSTNGFALGNKLFLCGYSQGGHATMALLRELETFHTNEFSVTACAPMAGAYDLSGTTLTDVLTNWPTPDPYYFLYLLGAYQSVYHLAPSLANLLAAPYNATLPPLLDGNHTGAVINSAMPANPLQVLATNVLAALQANPRHPIRLALQENDVYQWQPKAPMRLYQCAADLDVDPANAQVALNYFQTHGATQVQFFDPVPSADHVGCAEPSLLAAKIWFDTLK